MPILAKLLASLFGGLIAWLANLLGKKWALGLTFAGVFTGLTVALYAALSLLLNGLAATLPGWPGMEIAMWVAAPANLPAAIAAVLSAEASLTLYAWNVHLLRTVATSQ